MARRAKVCYFKSRGAYFTTINGKQHKLVVGADDWSSDGKHGPNYQAAVTAHADLVVFGAADTAGNCNTVRVICELYAQKLDAKKQAGSLKNFRQIADPFVSAYGDLRVEELKPFHVNQWLTKMAMPRPDTRRGRTGTTHWTEGMQSLGLRTLIAAFNHAVKEELITKHCLSKIEKKAKGSRGEEAYVPREVFDKIVAATNPNLADLLRFMWTTGCRPDEAYHVEAKYYDAKNRCVVFPGQPKPGDFVWKNVKRTSRIIDRIIYLTDETAEMVARRIKSHPTGPIFLTKFKTAWTCESVSYTLRATAARLGVRSPTPYGLRHTFATDFLLAGGSIKILADLLGTSVAMIERHYGHLQIDKTKMRGIMLAVMSERNGKSPATPTSPTA